MLMHFMKIHCTRGNLKPGFKRSTFCCGFSSWIRSNEASYTYLHVVSPCFFTYKSSVFSSSIINAVVFCCPNFLPKACSLVVTYTYIPCYLFLVKSAPKKIDAKALTVASNDRTTYSHGQRETATANHISKPVLSHSISERRLYSKAVVAFIRFKNSIVMYSVFPSICIYIL
jgi:hypothetical protein